MNAPEPLCNEEISALSELYVLGALLFWGEGKKDCEPMTSLDFVDRRHQWLWQLITELDDAGEPYTFDVVLSRLQERDEFDRVGGDNGRYVIELQAENGVSPVTLPSHAQTLRKARLLREIRATTDRLARQSDKHNADPEELIAEAESELLALQRQQEMRVEINAKDMAREAFKDYEDRFHTRGEIRGIPSGLAQVDAMTHGFQKTELIIVAARPSMGKTALALSIIESACIRNKKRTVFFSVEMGKVSIRDRLFAMVGNVDGSRVFSGNFIESDWPRLARASGEIIDAPLTLFDVPTLSVDEFRAISRKMKAQDKCDLIVVDYLQKMRADGEDSREREIAKISAGLKAMAKELDVPVIALAQLNRDVEKRGDKRPTMADLRESGSIEQDADLIMFLYRDEVYNQESPHKGIAEIITGKNRNGPIGTAKCAWMPNIMLFKNLPGDDRQ